MNSFSSNNRASRPSPESFDSSDSYFDVLGMLRRNWKTIGLFMMAGILAAAVYCVYAQKVYESSAALFIDEPGINTISTRDTSPHNASPNLGLEKYIEILRSDRIIVPAIEACGIDNLPSLRDLPPEEEIAEVIKENLYVRSSDKKAESGVITIGLSSTDADESLELLSTIISEFEKFVGDSASKADGQNVQTITQMKEHNQSEIRSTQAEIDKLEFKPDLQSEDGKVVNPFQQQVVKIQDEIHEKNSEQVKLESLLQRIEDARRQNQNVEDVVLDSLDQFQKGPLRHYSQTQQELVALQLREQELKSSFGVGHPDVKNAGQQIEILQRVRRQHLLAIFGSNSVEEDGAEIDFYASAVAHINNRLSLISLHQERLEAAMRVAKKKSLEIKRDCDRLTFLLNQKMALTQKSMTMTDHAIELGVLQDAQRRQVELINFPATGIKVHPKLKIFLPLGMVLGSLLGVCAALFKEANEKSFYSSKEVSDRMGLPVVAEIGQFDTRRLKSKEHQSVVSDVITLHHPHSEPAEMFKLLRTKILFESSQHHGNIIQLTSPTMGDGKSFVASNLAIVLAQAGRRVLLIDCDLRRPVLHEKFSVAPASPGLTDVLLGHIPFEEAVVMLDFHQSIELLTSGQQYGNSSEILSSSQLPKFLEDVRSQYDFIILDTPPILPVSDAKVVSHYADMIFLTVRISKGVQASSLKALELIRSAHEKIQGVIVNGISRQDVFSYSDTKFGSPQYGYISAYGDPRGLTEAELSPVGGLEQEFTDLQST